MQILKYWKVQSLYKQEYWSGVQKQEYKYVICNLEHLIVFFNQIKRNGNEEKNKVYAKIEIQI